VNKSNSLDIFLWVAPNIGHHMTFKILTKDKQKVMYCSTVHLSDALMQ